MPPIAKKYKVSKTESENSASEKDSPQKNNKPKVISGQLEKSIIKKQKKPYKTKRGVVFLKNLPNGFFEEQMQKYFQQFGKITRVRLARSVKTCTSKGFAFIEFAVPEVAQIAAETMNNYLMFKKIVKAAYIPPDEQKYDYFRTTVKKVKTKFGKEKFVSSKTRAINRQKRHLNNWSEENYAKRTQKQERKLLKMKQNLGALGFEVDSVVRRPIDEPKDKSASTSEESGASPSKKTKKNKQKATKEALKDSSVAKAKISDTPGTTSDENPVAKRKNEKRKRKAEELSENSLTGKESTSEANSSSQSKKQKQPKKKPATNGNSSNAAATTTDETNQPINTPPGKTRSHKHLKSENVSIDSSPTIEPISSASEKSSKDKKKLPKLSKFKDTSGYVVESLFESNFNNDDNIVLDDTYEMESAKDSTPESAGKKKQKAGKGTFPLKRLLEDTIEDDSSDEDFNLEGELESGETEHSEEEIENTKPKANRNKPDIVLKRLLENTMEEDSTDEDFQLEENTTDLSEEDTSDLSEEEDGEEEELDSSPQKSTNKKISGKVHTPTRLTKLDKIAQRKPHEGGIKKKQKPKKQQKSQALKQKIQETVKSMVAQKNILPSKSKGMKVGGWDVKKDKKFKKDKKRGL